MRRSSVLNPDQLQNLTQKVESTTIGEDEYEDEDDSSDDFSGSEPAKSAQSTPKQMPNEINFIDTVAE